MPYHILDVNDKGQVITTGTLIPSNVSPDVAAFRFARQLYKGQTPIQFSFANHPAHQPPNDNTYFKNPEDTVYTYEAHFSPFYVDPNVFSYRYNNDRANLKKEAESDERLRDMIDTYESTRLLPFRVHVDHLHLLGAY